MKRLLINFFFAQRVAERTEENFKYYPSNKKSLLFRRPFGAN